jgi:DNA-binding transcriptional MerR regulator
MKISELSHISGLPVATLKYYLREGLLPPGLPTAPNQASYDDSHVSRLRLIRTLVEVGHLPLGRVADVLAAIDDPDLNLHLALGAAQDAMVSTSQRDQEGFAEARDEADAVVQELAWNVRPDAATRDLLADAITVVRSSSLPYSRDAMVELGQLIESVARAEVAFVDDTSRVDALEYSVVGTVAYETALNALRRMALEHASAARWMTSDRLSPRRGRRVPSTA